MVGLLRVIAAAVLLSAVNPVAGAFPDRPLRYVLGSAAGGGPDVASRVVMAELSRQTGQQVIVENRPGASGVLGMEVIARATPDGYTL
ncbi:MAG TPA: tripartite tricarboxylate transporter substrate-binding protein, partial [Burkholderiales bacterium]|nr:tripartite tricarboxylate transporter substrate-binding protein [Burkholderiales bacterium]